MAAASRDDVEMRSEDEDEDDAPVRRRGRRLKKTGDVDEASDGKKDVIVAS